MSDPIFCEYDPLVSLATDLANDSGLSYLSCLAICEARSESVEPESTL